jgi:hypothetical protein
MTGSVTSHEMNPDSQTWVVRRCLEQDRVLGIYLFVLGKQREQRLHAHHIESNGGKRVRAGMLSFDATMQSIANRELPGV